MKYTKRLRMKGLHLVGLCLLSVFAFGGTMGSAWAAPLLFVPHSGKFPYHFVGGSGETRIVTLGGTESKSSKSDTLILVLNATLANLAIRALEVSSGGKPCGSPTAASKEFLMNLASHLGFAHPGNVPAILTLIPGHITVKCEVIAGIEVPVLFKGHLIGRITSPALNTASTLMLISFKQTSGEQEFTTFLLGNEILTNQFQEVSFNGGAFEKEGLEFHTTVHALPGEGTFLLVSP